MKSKSAGRVSWFALVLALGLVIGIATRQNLSAERSVQTRLQEQVERAENALRARTDTYESILRGASEFFANRPVTTESWQRYVNALDLTQKCPELYGLGYAQYITEDNRPRRLKILPSGKRFDYFVIRAMEPEDRNSQLMGYDLGSELSARTAAEAARDGAKNAVLTGKLILPDDGSNRTFLLLYPVKREGSFTGWVFGRFRQEDFLKGLFPANDPLRLQVYEGPAMTRESLFFDSAAPLSAWQKPEAGPRTLSKSFQVLGRTWTLNIALNEAAKPLAPKWKEMEGVPLFMVMGLFLFAAVLGWFWMRRKAAMLAQELTEETRQREAALTLGPHGIMVCDATEPDLPITYVNRAFEKMTGYSSQEVLGKSGRFLEGTDHDQKGLQELRRAVKEQRDARVLLRNYRKDGTPFWNDVFVAPLRNDMGRIVKMVSYQQDVTEREQTVRRLATEGAMVRALAESPTLFEAAPRILQAICEGQEWDLGTFWRLDQRTESLQCVDQWHPVDLDLHEFELFIRQTTLCSGMGVAGTVWAKREQVWLPDLSNEKGLPEAALALRAGLASACGFPIASRKGLLGVLVFYSRRIWPLSKNLLLLMVGASAQLSQYMEREQTEIEQKELTILERGLAEFMGEGLIAMDREGYCIYVNATAGRMLGYQPRILLGQNAHEFLHPLGWAAVCDAKACPIVLSLQSIRATYVDYVGAVFQRQNRDTLPVAYTVSPILDKDLIQGVVLTFVDVSARRVEEVKLQKALAEKEAEIDRIKQMMAQSHEEASKQPNPSDLLVDKIRKLLG